MADPDAACVLDVGGDLPVTAASRAQVAHFGEGALFGLVLGQRAILADFPPERSVAAEILPGPPLMALGVADALADPLTLKLEEPQRDPPLLGEGCEDAALVGRSPPGRDEHAKRVWRSGYRRRTDCDSDSPRELWLWAGVGAGQSEEAGSERGGSGGGAGLSRPPGRGARDNRGRNALHSIHRPGASRHCAHGRIPDRPHHRPPISAAAIRCMSVQDGKKKSPGFHRGFELVGKESGPLYAEWGITFSFRASAR
jgi:hypothetical protein